MTKNFHNDKPLQLNVTKKYDNENVNFTPQKYAGAVGLDRSPNPGLQARTGWDTCPASQAPLLWPKLKINLKWAFNIYRLHKLDSINLP